MQKLSNTPSLAEAYKFAIELTVAKVVKFAKNAWEIIKIVAVLCAIATAIALLCVETDSPELSALVNVSGIILIGVLARIAKS